MTPPLKQPARYFPVDGGIYQVKAGLQNLGTDFGNGEIDRQVVQLDSEFPIFRENKLQCRAERLGKYYARDRFEPAVQREVVAFLIGLLTREHPELFQYTSEGGSRAKLFCALTQETLWIEDFALVDADAQASPAYADAYDAIVNQLQEDVVVVRRTEKQDWLSAIHLCAAGHWAAEAKIGKDFPAVHEPVPHIAGISKASRALVHAMIQQGPFVRFVWGFGSDRRLNHHPEAPPGLDPVQWRGRSFEQGAASGCPFYLRVERQVTYGLPQIDAALFFIRVYYTDGRDLRRDTSLSEKLIQNLRTMSPETLAYKGLTDSKVPLIEWLSNQGPQLSE